MFKSSLEQEWNPENVALQLLTALLFFIADFSDNDQIYISYKFVNKSRFIKYLSIIIQFWKTWKFELDLHWTPPIGCLFLIGIHPMQEF